MNEGRVLAAAAAVTVALAVATAVLLGAEAPADASSLSRASAGWLAARRYLEERGTPVVLIDHPLDEPIGRGVLVLAFPWQQVALDDVPRAVDRHLQAGGVVLFAYTDRRDPMESMMAEALELHWWDRRPRPPLRPWRWRAYAAEEWTLSSPDGPRRETRIAALGRTPGAPIGANVLLQDAQGRAVAFSYARWRGRVVVIPSDLLANARIARPGNADLLEALREELGGTWLFDEFHHGLRAEPTAAETGPQRVLLLYVAQVAFVYALCALAVARRFGPAWRERPTPGRSAATFLVGLGALHHRLGHHAEAARLLVARARELDPRLALPPADVRDAAGFVRLARRVGASQSGRTAVE